MFKFLKKFKDKILIALACSFIGIGTILSNTLETKAYTTNTFTYTLTTETYNNTTYYKVDTNFVYKNFNFLLINFTSDVSGNWTTNLNLCDSNYNVVDYYRNSVYNVPNGVSFYFWNIDLSSFYCFNIVSSAQNFTIVNIDYVNSDDLSTTYYAQTYIDNYTNLQSQYDSLLLEYQTYTNTHAYTNEQYNSLMTQNATLTQQVQSLQSQYDTYVSLHSYTNTQYETLLNNYNNLNQIYSDLQVSYTSLQSQYNTLLNNYNYGIFGYLSWANFINTATQQTIKKPNTQEDEFTLNDLVTYGIIGQGGYFNMYVFENSSWNPNYNNIYADLYFYQSSVSGNLPTDLITISYNNNSSSIIEFLDTNGLSVTLNVDNYENGITGKDLYNANASFGAYVEEIHIKPNNAEQMGYYYTNSFYYQGYNTGYNYAYNRYKTQIDDLTQQVIDERNKNQVMYSNGYNEGFEARIILNLYME